LLFKDLSRFITLSPILEKPKSIAVYTFISSDLLKKGDTVINTLKLLIFKTRSITNSGDTR